MTYNTSNTHNAASNQDKQPPVKKFTIGTVTASIWEKQTQNGKTYYETSILRCYKNKDGELKNTSSLSQMELLAVSKLAARAESWIDAQTPNQN